MRSSPFAALDARLAPALEPKRQALCSALFGDVPGFAHRGLWDERTPENSLAAAAAAMAQGFGIECDVRLSRTGTPYVFHDVDGSRLCGRPERLDRLDDSEIERLRLGGSAEPVPTLAALLALVRGRAPLLIELKTEAWTVNALCLAVRRVLEGYRGPAGVMSFHPAVSRWFARNAPRVPHGLVMSERRTPRRRIPGDAVRRRMAVWRARPDFIAYDVRCLPSPLPIALHRRGLPLLAWTVRSQADHTRAAIAAAIPIFEPVRG